MSIFEYDKEEEERKLRKTEYEAGVAAGFSDGFNNGFNSGTGFSGQAVSAGTARSFTLSDDFKDKTVSIEFDGVQMISQDG